MISGVPGRSEAIIKEAGKMGISINQVIIPISRNTGGMWTGFFAMAARMA